MVVNGLVFVDPSTKWIWAVAYHRDVLLPLSLSLCRCYIRSSLSFSRSSSKVPTKQWWQSYCGCEWDHLTAAARDSQLCRLWYVATEPSSRDLNPIDYKIWEQYLGCTRVETWTDSNSDWLKSGANDRLDSRTYVSFCTINKVTT